MSSGGKGAREEVRVGVIGAGFIGRVHMEQFRRQPGVRLVGVADPVGMLADRAVSEYGVARVYLSADTLIDSDETDAIVVAAPNGLHRSLALRALAAGKDVLLEKPAAMNYREAADIARAQKDSGRILMIDHQMRFLWPFRQAAEQAAAGEFGAVYHAKAGWMRPKGIPGWGSAFTRKAESGGGPLIDIGVHMLDAAIWLMGSPRPTEVFGATYAEFGPRKKGIGTWGTPQWDGVFDVEDLASALIRFENGATLALDVSWAAHAESDGKPYVRLMGSEGGATIRDSGISFFGQKFGRSYSIEEKKPEDAGDARALLTAHFLECVRERKPPLIGAQSGAVVMAVIDAVYESARSSSSARVSLEGAES